MPCAAVFVFLVTVSWFNASLAEADQVLKQALQAKTRSEMSLQRDQFRHPLQTLAFFQVKPDHTVLEIWPGAGWYTEILAPFLNDEGQLIAAHFPEQSQVRFYQTMREKYRQKLAEHRLYQKLVLAEFHPPSVPAIVSGASVDRILTFRNVHNWLKAGYAQKAFYQFYDALTPGGVLGVVEHRALVDASREQMIMSGYVTEALIIELAEQAGFVLDAKSEINANPKDDRIHPKGVWSLPPSLRMGDVDRDLYLAIGESDRMTLRFIKP